MNKLLRIRNSVIVILCITIIFLGVGFIALSVELKKEKDEVSSFDVSFVKIAKTSSVKGSNVAPDGTYEIINGGKELNMQFTMNSIHDELLYLVTIQNKGNLPAEIVDIIESPDYSLPVFKKMINPVSITLSNVKGKILPAGEEMDLKISVYYNPSTLEVAKKVIPYRIGLITKSRQSM